MNIEVKVGDITIEPVGAIVNAANSSLLGGGGVDGAIHRTAGPQLLAECRKIGGCPTGSACITKAYKLPADYVIHTVGPIWHGGSLDEAGQLRSCYDECLKLADQYGLKSIAFPAISCGVYGYPHAAAVAIAVNAVKTFLTQCSEEIKIIFVCYKPEMADLYRKQLNLK